MIYRKLCENELLPMHMPGHKRNAALAPYLERLGADMDITEIDGFDNLHGAQGILAETMNLASGLWGSRRSWMLINGSTCGILAGIRALTKRGGRVLVSRAAHKSVFHAIELCGLEPVFIMPPIIDGMDILGSLSPEIVEDALAQNADISLVIVTSPTYEGIISDIKGICEAAHKRGIPVLVDEAHGAHLDLSPRFSGGAVRAGADIVIQSLHKTLPSLTQTAILHMNGSIADPDEIEHQLAVFETSSPSYLLMTSIDGCVRLLTEQPQIIEKWADALNEFDSRISGLEKLKIIGHGAVFSAYGFDRSKLPIYTGGTNMSGYELADILRSEFGIELEYALPSMALAMTGAGDTIETLTRLADALLAIDSRCEKRRSKSGYPIAEVMGETRLVLSIEQAMSAEREFIEPKNAVGKVCGEYIWAYPPGIPLIIPGEIIPEAFAEMTASPDAPELHSTFGKIPAYIYVLS